MFAAGYLFVDDVEVVRMVAAICPIAALYQFPDGILGCIGGVLRGMGRQTYLMAFNLIGMLAAILSSSAWLKAGDATANATATLAFLLRLVRMPVGRRADVAQLLICRVLGLWSGACCASLPSITCSALLVARAVAPSKCCLQQV